MALLDELWDLGLVERVAPLRSHIAEKMLEAKKEWDVALVARIEAGALHDSDSLWTLARLYSGQVGFPRQEEQLFFYLVLAAQEGCVTAVRLLGIELIDRSIREYEAVALCLLECAAQHEDSLSCGLLGDCYADGKHRIPNPRASYQWYLKGAELGYDYCMEKVIRCQQLGLGVEPDESVLCYWTEALTQKKKRRGVTASDHDSQKSTREHEAQIIPFSKTRG
jgi:TPR repeat protein